jgi:hypothetical protein
MGSGTTGGGGILIVTGLEAEFSVSDSWGNTQTVKSTKYMGVKRGNTGSDLLGMIQLADLSVSIQWDPQKGAGELRI